jgi:hypothetical protein
VSDTVEEGYVISEDSAPWTVTYKPTENAADDQEATVAPSIGVPLGEKSDITAKFEYWKKIPNDPKNTESSRYGEMGFHTSISDVEFRVKGWYKELLDAAADPKEYQNGGSVGLTKTVDKIVTNFNASELMRSMPTGKEFTAPETESTLGVNFVVPFEKFSSYTAIDHRHITPAPGIAFVNWDKVDSTTISLNLERGFDNGFYTKLMTSYEMFDRFIIDNIPVGDFYATADNGGETRPGEASGTTSMIAGSLSYPLFDFLTINTYAQYSLTKFNVPDKGIEVGFLKQVTSDHTYCDLTLALKKTF